MRCRRGAGGGRAGEWTGGGTVRTNLRSVYFQWRTTQLRRAANIVTLPGNKGMGHCAMNLARFFVLEIQGASAQSRRGPEVVCSAGSRRFPFCVRQWTCQQLPPFHRVRVGPPREVSDQLPRLPTPIPPSSSSFSSNIPASSSLSSSSPSSSVLFPCSSSLMPPMPCHGGSHETLLRPAPSREHSQGIKN